MGEDPRPRLGNGGWTKVGLVKPTRAPDFAPDLRSSSDVADLVGRGGRGEEKIDSPRLKFNDATSQRLKWSSTNATNYL